MSLDQLRQSSHDEPWVGFRCWTPENVDEVLDREAASATRKLLLATHIEPQVRRVSLSAGSYVDEGGVTQDDLLSIVKEGEGNSLIVPIVGASGTGKSHLVLWLRAKLLESNDGRQRRIIYVPKGQTTLAGVIELIIEGFEGGRFDDLRDSVREASTSMGDRERALRLRAELAIRVEQLDPIARGESSRQMRTHVAKMMPALLNDAVFEQHLVRDTGTLQRILHEAVQGASDTPAQFEEADLRPAFSATEQEEIGGPAKTLLGQLANPDLLRVACEVLNEVCGPALSKVFGVEPMQLVNVLRELRQRIFDADPHTETLLMIEDFTLLQGIQHDLLEAMIELRRGEGRSEICEMRTVMAVTSGFFQDLFARFDTLSTRVSGIYSLDVPYGADNEFGLEAGTVRRFTGRYLNAVRAGVEEIERKPSAPNACEVCAHKSACHDAFGVSDDEFGLYPFNGRALDRMRGRQRDFNPRDLLSMLSRTLEGQGDDLASGRFPSEAWAALFDPRAHDLPALPSLTLSVERQIEQRPKPEQRKVLLTFWGDQFTRIVNLDHGVHTAFQIPTVALDTVEDVESEEPIEEEVTTRRSQRRRNAESVAQAWRDGDKLPSNEANVVRRVVHAAISGALDTQALLLSRAMLDQVFERRDVDLERAEGSGRERAGHHYVRLPADNETASFVAALLDANDPSVPAANAVQAADWSRAPWALAKLSAIAQREAVALQQRLAEVAAVERRVRESALCALILSGLALGQGSVTSPEGWLTAAFSRQSIPRDHLPHAYRTVLDPFESDRAAAQAFVSGVAQVRRGETTDGVGVLGQAFLQTARAFTDGWELPEAPEESPVRGLTTRAARLAPGLEVVHDHLTEWLAEIGPLIGDPDAWSTTVTDLEKILEAARSEGFGAAGSPDANIRPQEVASGVTLVAQLLSGWAAMPMAQRAKSVAGLPWARLPAVTVVVQHYAAALRRATERAMTTHAGAESTAALDAFEDALGAVDSQLESLLEEVTTS